MFYNKEIYDTCWRCGGLKTIIEVDEVTKVAEQETCYECDGVGAFLSKEADDLITFLTSIGIPIPNPNGWKDLF